MTWPTPRVWTAGEKITATKLNEISAALNELGDPWTDYSPTWTGTVSNPTNYTGSGAYVETGKTVRFKARVTANAASFTPGSGLYRISLPVAIFDAIAARFFVTSFDSSANQIFVGSTYSVSGTVCPVGYNSTASGLLAAVTPTAPFTFAANDHIEVHGVYEAA